MSDLLFFSVMSLSILLSLIIVYYPAKKLSNNDRIITEAIRYTALAIFFVFILTIIFQIFTFYITGGTLFYVISNNCNVN